MNYDYLAKTSFNAGIYIRLSQEDRDKKYDTDSESVINQKEILKEYVEKNGYNLYKAYVDDGFTGTNFDRPAFKEMIEDIKDKKINMVVVKDLSRLGRDHVMTGYYIETFFPENRVRFISLVENYDSMKNQSSNDSSMFIIAFNDYYSKQNSLKIRNVLDSKRREGKFIGSSPCYGYKRDPDDKGHLIPDENTSKYVKMIFEWRAEGVKISDIATRLTDMGVKTPSAYKNLQKSSRLKNNDKWTISSIKKILQNKIYTGDMVQHCQTNINYKSKKKITLDENFWITVEGTHEPIISKDLFMLVEKMRKSHDRSAKSINNRKRRLLEGLVFCKECGNRIGITYRKNHDYWSMNCNRYAREPRRRFCTPHFFPYEYFEKQFINNIQICLKDLFNKLNIKELNEEIIKLTNNKSTDLEIKKAELEKEKEKLSLAIQVLYQDRLSGSISVDTFRNLSEPYEKKTKDISNKLLDVETEILKRKYNSTKIPDYTQNIKKLLNLKKPTKDLLKSLIHKIEVDDNRVVTIIFKNQFLPDYSYQYIDENLNRNPYGRKGKPKNK